MWETVIAKCPISRECPITRSNTLCIAIVIDEALTLLFTQSDPSFCLSLVPRLFQQKGLPTNSSCSACFSHKLFRYYTNLSSSFYTPIVSPNPGFSSHTFQPFYRISSSLALAVRHYTFHSLYFYSGNSAQDKLTASDNFTSVAKLHPTTYANKLRQPEQPSARRILPLQYS